MVVAMKKSISLLLFFLCACQTPAPTPPKISSERYAFKNLPFLEKGLPLGGFSGLSFEGQTTRGEWIFKTHTDRGPNLASTPGTHGEEVRPFVLPSFQPEWIQFYFDPVKKELSLQQRTALRLGNGKKISGRPNFIGPQGDEIPVDSQGHRIPTDPMGLDLEGLVRDPDGSYWMSEEYRPSLLHFDEQGVLLSRWIPEGNKKLYGTAHLPSHYRRRIPNRGFEGIALKDPFIFLFLQSPLKGDHGVTRILKVDKKTGTPVAEYAYVFETTPAHWPVIDKIGDAVYLKDDQFLVVEQNAGTESRAFRRVYKIDLQKATNILGKKDIPSLSPSQLCSSEACEKGLIPVQKTEIVDLAATGFSDLEKIEGLVVVDASTLALVNDNDFKVNGSTSDSFLGIIHLTSPLR